MFRDAALVKLKNDINKNIIKYENKFYWIDKYFDQENIDDFCLNTKINIDDIKLVIGDQDTDAQNAIIVYEAMKNLLPIHARDERLWSYLTHTIGYEYMQHRWPLVGEEKNKISRINSRYFFQGKTQNVIKTTTVPYVRNGLARLWWAGYIVYDETEENHYEYINELFVSQDMFVGLCERDIAKNKDIVTSILKCVRKYKIKEIPNNTQLVRNILKEINMKAGLVVLDALNRDNIELIIQEIFLNNIQK